MVDSEVRIRHIFFKPNSSHLQFKAEKKEGEVLNKPSAYTSPACDRDSAMAEKTACTCCSMRTNACVQNSFQLHLTARPAQYDWIGAQRQKPECVLNSGLHDAFVLCIVPDVATDTHGVSRYTSVSQQSCIYSMCSAGSYGNWGCHYGCAAFACTMWLQAVRKCSEYISHPSNLPAFNFRATAMPSLEIYRWPLIKL